jgi:hypothetical protein
MQTVPLSTEGECAAFLSEYAVPKQETSVKGSLSTADHDLQSKSVDSASAISLGSQRRMGLVLVIITPF